MSISLTPKQSREIACKNFHFMVGGVVKGQFDRQKVFDHFDELSCLLIVEKTNESEDQDYDLFNILLTVSGNMREERSTIDRMVRDLFGDEVSITHLGLKHVSSAIKTFSDEALVFKGCLTNSFSDSIKRKLYARSLNGRQVNILDPFVQANSGQLRFIEQTVEAIQRPLPIVNRLFPFKYKLDENGRPKKFGNWRDIVVAFLNDWIRNGWQHKKKHLCLYGVSNSGKSTLCNALLGNYEHQNFPIGINDSKFAFDRWNPSLYTHCLVHEFDFSKIDSTTWKIALEGLPFKMNRKHKTGVDGAIQVPFIFLCNDKPKAMEDPALFNRIQFVECISEECDKIASIDDYLEVDTSFTDHKLTPEIKHYFPIGALKFPVCSYNEPVGEKEPAKKPTRSITIDSDSGFSHLSSRTEFSDGFSRESEDFLNDHKLFKARVALARCSSTPKISESNVELKRDIEDEEDDERFGKKFKEKPTSSECVENEIITLERVFKSADGNSLIIFKPLNQVNQCKAIVPYSDTESTHEPIVEQVEDKEVEEQEESSSEVVFPILESVLEDVEARLFENRE
ncbi:unnamed protein product [Brachionus calyciflorus]|uniref:SF3 helicase domain-containing protein n=1 Tax=Brachionus calyciflorus TaxID=104777 RepID=A0A814JEB6_9BILA|nr:unnamed protein product [Brachionus calyciflorus]